LYLSLLAAVNSRAIDVPDLPELLRELRGLERRQGTAGRDKVDHGPGQHDDLANALAGLVHAVPAQRFGGVVLTGGMMQSEKERLGGVLVDDPLQRSALRWAAVERHSGGRGGLVI
jgi:hypothetical protein